MPQTFNVGSRSLFVTTVAWVFIALALLASASAVVQNAAVASLLRYGAEPLLVDEGVIEEAVELLDLAGGPRTTPSGATGLAGLLHVSRDTEARVRLKLDRESRILLVVTEGV